MSLTATTRLLTIRSEGQAREALGRCFPQDKDGGGGVTRGRLANGRVMSAAPSLQIRVKDRAEGVCATSYPAARSAPCQRRISA